MSVVDIVKYFDYKINEVLKEDEKNKTLLCYKNGLKVIFKIINNEQDDFIKTFLFKSEIAKANKLGFIELLNLEEKDNAIIYSYKYIEGEPFSRLIFSQMTLQEILDIIYNTLLIIKEAHDNLLYHLDLHFDNLIYNRVTKRVFVTDFGLHNIKENNMLLYCLPEFLIRRHENIHKTCTDIYLLGGIFYRILTGICPFKVDHEKPSFELFHRIVPPSCLNKSVPKELSDLIIKMLDIEPLSRPKIEYVIDVIEKIKSGIKVEINPFVVHNIDFIFTDPPFIGREDQIFLLYKEINKFCSEKNGGIIFIKGKEGIGKTRLLSEALKISNCSGNIIEVKCGLNSKFVSYSLIKELLFQVLVVLRSFDSSFKNVRLTKEMSIKELLNVIKSILPSVSESIFLGYDLEISSPDENDEVIRREKFLFLVGEILDFFIQKYSPFILIFENLEYADKVSLEVLRILKHKLVSKTLIIGIFNSELVDENLKSFVEDSQKTGAKTIEVSELSFSEVQSFVQKFLNNYSENSIFLSSLLYTTTKGNPFFIIQLLKHFLPAIFYDKKHNMYKVDKEKIKSIKVPEFLFEPLTEMLNSLSRKTFEFLKVFSIVGDGFDSNFFVSLNMFTIEEIQSSLEELTSNLVLYEKKDLYSNCYYFTHLFVRDVVLSSMGADEKEIIKEKILNRLIKLYDENKKENILIILGEIALERSDKSNLLSYLYDSAVVYKNNFWYENAIKYFKSIVDFIETNNLPKNDLYFDSLFNIANISTIIGDLNSSVKYGFKILKSEKLLYKIKGFYTIGEASFKKGEIENAITYFNKTIALVKGKRYLPTSRFFILLKRVFGLINLKKEKGLKVEDLIFINSLYFLIWIYSFTNYRKTKSLILLLKNYTDSLLPSISYHFIGFKVLAGFYISVGKIKKAKKIIKHALNIAKHNNNLWGMGICYQVLGHIFQIEGMYEDSIIALNTAIEYFDRLKDIRELTISLLVLSYNYYYKSDYNTAAKTYNRFTSLFNYSNDYYGILSSLIIQAKIFIEKSDYNNAENILRVCYKISSEKGIDYIRAFISLEIAKLKIHQMDIEGAKEILSKSYNFFKSSGSFVSYFMVYYPTYISIVVEEYKKNTFISSKEKRKFIKTRLKEIEKVLNITKKWINYKYIAIREAARFYEAIGRDKKAFKFYKKAIEGLEKHKRLYELALSLYYFGLFLQNKFFKLDPLIFFKKSYSIFEFIGNTEYKNKISSIINVQDDKSRIKDIDSIKLKMIINFNTEIAGVLDLRLLLDLIIEYSIKITGAERGIIFLKENGNIEPVAYKCVDKVDTRLPRTLVENVIKSGDYFITTNIDRVQDNEITSYNIRSILCMPIKKDKNVIGAIYLDNSLVSGVFTDEEINLLSVFTNQAYVSIENARLHRKVIRDELTGVFSRTYFDFLIDKEIARSERYQSTFSILYADVDNFSFLTDMYGQKRGDETIKVIGKILTECVRTTDYVARYYGDKFFILLPETDIVGAEILAKRILSKIRDYDFEGIKITVSIGIVNYPYNSTIKATLLSLAEDALNNAKKMGKDCYFIQKTTRFIDEKDIYLDTALSKLQRFSDVIKITHDISSLLKIEKVVEKILEKALSIIGENNGIIAVEDEEKGELKILTSKGFEKIPDYTYPLIEKCFKAAKSIFIDQAELGNYDITTDDINVKRIKGIFVTPIKYKREIKGIFYSHVSRKPEPSDIMVLDIVLSQAAISIENAKFYRIGVEIQRLEAEREYLERLNKLKNEFINMLSHDLKSPVAKIKMVSNLMRQYYDDFDKKQKEEFLLDIENSSDFVLKLIENLLDISKIERGEFKLEKEEVDFVEFVNNVIRENIILAKNKGISIKYEYSDDVPRLSIDKIKITQVCNNLISNAIKFSPINSEIVIRVYKDHKDVIFSVKDSGPGIPENERDNIFRKEFYQTSVKATKGEKGTGLGLFISKKIIDIHEGSIGFESEEGKGSTFYFRLPISM